MRASHALLIGHPAQALTVYNAIEWLASTGMPQVGRPITADERYWPVPPMGIFYVVRGDDLVITAVRDARRRRRPW